MNSDENTNMSNISMEELIAIGEYFSGNIPSDDEQFETDVEKFLENPYFEREEPEKEAIVIRPKPRKIPKNYTGKRGTAPQWKYSKRQQEKAALIEEAFKRLKGTPGLPETTGGLWFTDNDLIKEEVEKIKAERNPKIPKKRGRPPKAKVEGEVKVPKKRGRPPKAKTDGEAKVPKKRGRPPKAKTEVPPKKRQTVADRFRAQMTVRPSIPSDSVVTKVGPGKYNIAVDLNKRPTRQAPGVPKGVSPWKPTPNPRTVLPIEKPIPKPRTAFPKDELSRSRFPVKPTPKPRTKLPNTQAVHGNKVVIQDKIPIHKPKVDNPKIRKSIKQLKEVKESPQVITPELHEIDPFGTDLQKPGHRKIETAANGAAVTYMITPQYMDPLEQMTSSRQVVRGILVNNLKKMGGLKYTNKERPSLL